MKCVRARVCVDIARIIRAKLVAAVDRIKNRVGSKRIQCTGPAGNNFVSGVRGNTVREYGARGEDIF